jgi:hypothetical protein
MGGQASATIMGNVVRRGAMGGGFAAPSGRRKLAGGGAVRRWGLGAGRWHGGRWARGRKVAGRTEGTRVSAGRR